MRYILRGIVASCWAALSPLAWAHDPGLSSANITISADHIEIVTTFAGADARWLVADDSGKETLDPDSDAFHTLLEKAALPLWHLEVAGQAIPPASTIVTSAPGNNVSVAQDFVGKSSALVQFTTSIFALLPPGHRQHVTIIGSDHQLLVAKLLSAADSAIQTALPGPAKNGAVIVPVSSADYIRLSKFSPPGREPITAGPHHTLARIGGLRSSATH